MSQQTLRMHTSRCKNFCNDVTNSETREFKQTKRKPCKWKRWARLRLSNWRHHVGWQLTYKLGTAWEENPTNGDDTYSYQGLIICKERFLEFHANLTGFANVTSWIVTLRSNPDQSRRGTISSVTCCRSISPGSCMNAMADSDYRKCTEKRRRIIPVGYQPRSWGTQLHQVLWSLDLDPV